MYKSLIIVLLLSVALAGDDSDSYFLSPPLPPTAYKGEFYTVQFRVIGLDNPVFSFQALPPCFKSYDDGTIEGIPDVIGSFSASVCFQTKKVKVTRNIVFRIAPSVSSTQKINTKDGVTAVNQFIVVNNNNQYTFLVGDKIDFSIQAQNGKGPYKWSYNNLPSSLSASADGKITGLFSTEGYYSFSASACDSLGSIADSYFTVNVQPKTLTKSSVLLQVPNRNVPVRYDLEQVQAQQLAAENAVFAAIRITDDKQKEAASARSDLAKATLALQFSTSQEDAAEANAGNALKAKNAAAAAESKAHDILEDAVKIVELAKTNLHNAEDVTDNARKELNKAQHTFDEATADLNTANNKFINGQTETAQAAQNVKAAITTDLNARNVYKLVFNSYSEAKKTLQAALDKKQKADILVNNAQNAVNVVNQLNDNAQSQLVVAQNAYEQAYSALNNANTVVSQLRGNLDDASEKLGVAKFNLQQTLNNLFVAQSRKEQADKATAIVRAQTSVVPSDDSTSTYIFGGCTQQAYPTVAGSASISRFTKSAYQLSSGNTLVFGSCTSRVGVVAEGDIITYTGYLKDGFVHCTSYQKAL